MSELKVKLKNETGDYLLPVTSSDVVEFYGKKVISSQTLVTSATSWKFFKKLFSPALQAGTTYTFKVTMDAAYNAAINFRFSNNTTLLTSSLELMPSGKTENEFTYTPTVENITGIQIQALTVKTINLYVYITTVDTLNDVVNTLQSETSNLKAVDAELSDEIATVAEDAKFKYLTKWPQGFVNRTTASSASSGGHQFKGCFYPRLSAGKYCLHIDVPAEMSSGSAAIRLIKGTSRVLTVSSTFPSGTSWDLYFTIAEGSSAVGADGLEFNANSKKFICQLYKFDDDLNTKLAADMEAISTDINTVTKNTLNLCDFRNVYPNVAITNSREINNNSNYDLIYFKLEGSKTYRLTILNSSTDGSIRCFDKDGIRESTISSLGNQSITLGDNGPYDVYLSLRKKDFLPYENKIMLTEGDTRPDNFQPWQGLYGQSNLGGFYQKALQVYQNNAYIKELCCYDKNILHVHIGSSTSAWQASELLAPEGVCEVPATCDRQGVAYGLWKNSVFGNPVYRRYDYGKASLVGSYCDKWTDDTNGFFIETGIWNASYGNFTQAANARTTLDTEVSPIAFDSAGSDKHIPRRYSNDNNASVSFTVSGYKRVSFIYNSNNYGDTVTVSTNRNNGIVTISSNFDMTDAVEANSATFSTYYSNTTNIGYPNQMIHFDISDRGSTTITLTKTSDTTKYFIYWGCVYYSTSNRPYAHVFANNSQGGANATTVWTHRAGWVGSLKPDLVTYQLTTINNITSNTPNFSTATAALKGSIDDVYGYCSNLGSNIAFILQHIPKERATAATGLNDVRDIFACLVRHIKENNYILFANADNLLSRLNEVFYPELSYNEFISLLSRDTKHFNTDGFAIYNALFKLLK